MSCPLFVDSQNLAQGLDWARGQAESQVVTVTEAKAHAKATEFS